MNEFLNVEGLDVLLKDEKASDITLDLKYEGINPWSYAMGIYKSWEKHVKEADERRTDSAFYTENKKTEYTVDIDMTVGSYAGAIRPSIGITEPVIAEDGFNYVDQSDYSIDLNRPNWSFGERAFRTVDTINGYEYKEDEQLDQYGGFTGMGQIGQKSGFFHAEFINGRWWIIDPLGYPFFRTAINTIGPKKNTLTKPEEFKEWAQKTTDRLHELGFNCAGGWSNEYLHDANDPLVYTMITKTLRSYAQQLNADVSTAGGTQFAKGVSPVFNPSFVEYAKKSLEEQLTPYLNDPNIYGWMSDNELEYNDNALEGYLSLDPSRPENAYLYAMGKTFLYMKTGKTSIAPEEIPVELKKELVGLIYDRYFDVVSSAMKAVDPNHMYIGSRFVSGCVKNDNVLKIAGLYCDVITYNCYKNTSMKSEIIQKIQNLAGRPFAITEWYAMGMDACNVKTGLTNTSGAGWIVRTQNDRGIFYQSFALKLMECKYCVGFDWFHYRDNDPKRTDADVSNTSSNKGVVDVNGEEYTDLTKHMGIVNNAKYSIINFFDERNG